MIAKVYRYDPTVDTEPYYKSYEVDVKAEDRMTVMELLLYISENLDGTLSFFSHSACQHGICGRCAVRCSGKPCLACEKVLDGTDVTIEPVRQPVVKDLVVRN